MVVGTGQRRPSSVIGRKGIWVNRFRRHNRRRWRALWLLMESRELLGMLLHLNLGTGINRLRVWGHKLMRRMLCVVGINRLIEGAELTLKGRHFKVGIVLSVRMRSLRGHELVTRIGVGGSVVPFHGADESV